MYVRRFKYTAEDVACKLCTEYSSKKEDCPLLVCPWIAERIEAGVVSYKEAIQVIIPRYSVYGSRVGQFIQKYNGSLWLNDMHKNRMQWFNHQLGYVPQRNKPAYYAAMYLLTSNEELHKRTFNCFYSRGVEMGYAVLHDISPHNYALFCGACEICGFHQQVTPSEMADPEIIDDEVFYLLINAKLIAGFGLSAFSLKNDISQNT